MDFSLNQDHDDVRRTVRDFLRKAGSETDVRRIMETSAGYDLDGWETLCSDLGVVAIGVPGHLGGIDLGFEALSVVMEELGAALYPSPLFATRILATEALLRTADESVADVVEGFVSGASIGALALSDYTGCWTPERVSVTATARDGDHTLTGLASFVVDGAVADVVVVVADLDGAPSIFLVDHGATGYETQPLQTVDRTRRQARLLFCDTPARLVGQAGAATEVIPPVLDLASIALAAESVGGAQRCLDLAVEHAKQRSQFGRPIGSFQAIKHKCADVLLEVEAARPAVRTAAWSVDHAPQDVPLLASLVKAHSADMYMLAAKECIQIHGGIGFTSEYPAQLYFKRAHSSALIFGTAQHHREALAKRVLSA